MDISGLVTGGLVTGGFMTIGISCGTGMLAFGMLMRDVPVIRSSLIPIMFGLAMAVWR